MDKSPTDVPEEYARKSKRLLVEEDNKIIEEVTTEPVQETESKMIHRNNLDHILILEGNLYFS